ncbi:MAG TPA: amidohydrolase family protein [Stellaceae bacterium]|nr:amidohydrolase family protein [Stellaceae bacterium]
MSRITRRDVIAGLCATVLLPDLAIAQSKPNPRRIDVHHHTVPPFLLERTRAALLASSPYANDVIAWTPEASIAQMDRWGIATAILSNPTQWSSFKDEAAGLCRRTNEYSAQLRDAHKGRFGFFGAVPLPDTDAALEEAAYALDTLKADGIGLITSYGDKYPSDPQFDPLFAELNRRKTVVFIHPTAPGCCTHVVPGVPVPTVEFMFDVTRCITAMLFHGVFTRYPDIRFIFTHDGAALPMLADRITRNATVVKGAGFASQAEAMAVLKRLHYDITTSTSPPALTALKAFLPVSQMLFGTDFPFLKPGDTVPGFARFPLSAAERRAVDRGNAEKLFPRLRA